jgi:hypothetical protein
MGENDRKGEETTAGAANADNEAIGSSPVMQGSQAVGNTGPLGHQRSIGLSIVFFIITFGIYGAIWAYKTHNEIKQHADIGVGGVVGLVIYLLIGVVTLFVIPSEVGQMYRKDGREPPVRGVTGLWNLIPLIGTIIWFVKVQGALNRSWEAKGVPA